MYLVLHMRMLEYVFVFAFMCVGIRMDILSINDLAVCFPFSSIYRPFYRVYSYIS